MVKLGFGFDQGLGLAVQYENINTFLGNDGMAADYILRENAVDEGIPFNWTIAGGIFVGWHNGTGLRLPLGLNMAFNAKWDAYLQLNPALDFDYGKKVIRTLLLIRLLVFVTVFNHHSCTRNS
tara:strand:+ start:8883 stop:9251 length:369 start_codon:yes stop_codon:yes gene_type:complete